MNAWEKYKQDREKRKQEENKQFSGSSSWAAYKANQEEQKARESRLEELRAKYGIKDGTGGAIPRPTDPELTPRLAALRAKYGIATQSKAAKASSRFPAPLVTASCLPSAARCKRSCRVMLANSS